MRLPFVLRDPDAQTLSARSSAGKAGKSGRWAEASNGHVRGILRKLDVHSMAQAVALAFELGIVAVEPHEDSIPLVLA